MNKATEKFVQQIPGWLEIKEGRFLEYATRMTKSLKGDIVEIGSFCGKSTIYLAQSRSRVYAIDPHQGDIGEEKTYADTYNRFVKNLKKARVFNSVVPLVKTSAQACQEWNKPIRILFIDGLHDEKNALLDFTLWSPHVVNDGIIAIHDSFCRWCGSEKVAVKKLIISNKFYKIGVVGSITYGVKGKGNFFQLLIKYFVATYLIFRIELNHLIILLTNFSKVKNKLQSKIRFSSI